MKKYTKYVSLPSSMYKVFLSFSNIYKLEVSISI